ncbi:MAG: hypothetical protein OXG44_09495 [Gammaproteobacteria bacterium]|nr:hypothetical protein [Gammaproteobacteria bacterium]
MNNSPTHPHNRLHALRRVDPVILGILVLALVAGLLVVIRTWEFGIGLSPDSVHYVSMARALGTDEGPHLRPTWPPLFVLLLAAPRVVGVDPIDAAAVLNPSILVCICLVSGCWFYRRTNSGLVSVVVTAALAFSIPLTRVSSFVWTEPLFVLLTVCSLALLDSHLRNDSLKVLMLAALFAAFACLTRYAGIALLASTVLILLSKPQVTLRKRVVQALSYSVIAALPVCLWLLRNHLLSETFVGGRTAGIWSFADNAERAVLTLGAWALPWGRRDQGLELLIPGVPLLAVVGFALAWVWSSSRSRGVRETISCLKLSDPFARVLAVYAMVYVAFILTVSTAIRIDPINDRLLVPCFVPLALLAGFAVERLIAMSKRDHGERFGVAFAIAVVMFAASHVAAYIPELRFAAYKGHGYASRTWETSASISWIRRTDAQRLLTNRWDALHLLVPEVAVESLPRNEAELAAIVSSIGERRVVWFHGTSYPYDLTELSSDLGLGKVVEFDDGVVFEVRQPRGTTR